MTDEQTMKVWSMYTIEYYDKIMLFTSTWIKLEDIIMLKEKNRNRTNTSEENNCTYL